MDNNVYDLVYIVNSVMADVEEVEARQFARYLKWANDGFRRLNLANLMPTVKSVTLLVDQSTNTADLPNDYLYFTKIGVCCNGIILNFDMCDDLCFKKETPVCPCSDDEIQQQIDQCCNWGLQGQNYQINNDGNTWYYPYYTHWHNGQFMAGYYGAGAGFYHGGYRIDDQNRRIQFNSCLHLQEVLLEYVSSGIDATGNALVEQTAIPALTAYVHWQRCQFAANKMVSVGTETKRTVKYSPHSDTEQWRRRWIAEAKGMASRENAMNKHEWIQLFRALTFQVPKR